MSVRDVSIFASGVAVVGSISSQLMNLSAIPSIYQIYKARSTLLYPAFPFAISVVASVNGITYAVATVQNVVLVSCFFSVTQNSTYLLFHLKYSKDPIRILKTFIGLLVFEVIIMMFGPMIYCIGADSESCKSFSISWLGSINTAVYCLVYCGQLSTFQEVIRNRNSASISPWLTAGTLFCALVWTWYSILVDDIFYLLSSLVGDISGGIQVFLLLKYPSIQSNDSSSSDIHPLKADVVGVIKPDVHEGSSKETRET